MRNLALIPLSLILASCNPQPTEPPSTQLVIWAWERAEDLRFAPQAEIAIQAGFIEVAGSALRSRGRYFPLKAVRPPTTIVVHVEIDHSQPLVWSPALRSQLAAAILFYAKAAPAVRVQLDFEVRQSERQILLDALADLRHALPSKTRLSMTALASWCMFEDWLATAPVDEIVPMLFRMQKDGPAIIKTLADGGDFRNPRCRAALAISSDSAIVRAPLGRRVYLFNPRSWTQQSFSQAQRVVEAWR